jgi:hypothetical protein
MRVSEFDQARSDIAKLVDLDPSMKKEGERLLVECAGLEKEQDRKAKAVYANFFK